MRACRRAAAFVVAALAAAGASAQAAAPGLGLDLPPGTPARATLRTLERIQGDVETSLARVVYEFYVEPARGGLYAITRYQVFRKAAGADGTESLESEKYVWNVGRHIPLRCFARERAGGWRALSPDSNEYRAEMITAMGVYSLHRAATLNR